MKYVDKNGYWSSKMATDKHFEKNSGNFKLCIDQDSRMVRNAKKSFVHRLTSKAP